MKIKSVISLIACSLMTVPQVEAAVGPDGHIYSLTPAQTWLAAEATAVAAGGHLAAINDAAEEAFLRANFGLAENFWIGFTDKDLEGAANFVWISGDPVTFTHWNAGEPNNLGNEDFTVMNWNNATGAWNDLGANSSERGIIEVVPPPPTGVPDGGSTMVLLGASVIGLVGLRRFQRNH